jgi:hypothetical protein
VSIAGYETGARTLLPAGATKDDLVKFNLSFTLNGTSIFKQFNDLVPGDLEQEFFLGEGVWNLTVEAFLADAPLDGYDNPVPVAETAEAVAVEVVSGEVTDTVSVTLVTVASGDGAFAWDMTWPEDIADVLIAITQVGEDYVYRNIFLNTEEGGSDSGTYTDLGNGYARNVGEETLPVGSYYIATTVTGPLGTYTRRDALQIFPGMTTHADAAAGYAFTAEDFSSIRYVTRATGNNYVEGSLPWAVYTVPEGGTVQVLLPPGTEINLNYMSIYTSMTIEGNGVVLTNPSGAALYVDAVDEDDVPLDVTLRRIHFKDNQGVYDGGAIVVNRGNLTVESSLFTGNHAQYAGGAIVQEGGALTLLGNTFYNNTANSGGAIYVATGGTAKLGGNIFYGNTAITGNVVRNSGGSVTSLGGNVSDWDSGTGFVESGFVFEPTDVGPVASVPFNPATFRPLDDSTKVVSGIPGYPAYDFDGNPIPGAGAQAGAVQTLALPLTAGNFVSTLLGLTEPGVYAYTLDDDVTVTANPGIILNKSGVHIILKGNGHTLTLGTGALCLFDIGTGDDDSDVPRATLTLENIILQGGGFDGRGIHLATGGAFNMQAGTVIRGFSATDGAGVQIQGANTSFVKTGGTIYGKYQDAVGTLENEANANIADEDRYGHGVSRVYNGNQYEVYRSITAGPGDNLSVTVDGDGHIDPASLVGGWQYSFLYAVNHAGNVTDVYNFVRTRETMAPLLDGGVGYWDYLNDAIGDAGWFTVAMAIFYDERWPYADETALGVAYESVVTLALVNAGDAAAVEALLTEENLAMFFSEGELSSINGALEALSHDWSDVAALIVDGRPSGGYTDLDDLFDALGAALTTLLGGPLAPGDPLDLGGKSAGQIKYEVLFAFIAGHFSGTGADADHPIVIPVTGVDLSVGDELANLYQGVAAAIPGVVGGSPNYTISSGALSLDLSACETSDGTITGVDSSILLEASRYRFVGITLPTTVTNLAPGGMYSQDGTFKNFRNLLTITTGEITTVGDYAFSYCQDLTTLSFPLATQIGTRAFNNCTSLTTLSLPAATNLGNYVFDSSTALTTLILGDTPPPILGDYIFDSTGNTPLTLQVPGGTKVAYAAWLTANATKLAFPTGKPVWIDDSSGPASLHLGGRSATQITTVVTAAQSAELFDGDGTVATPYLIPVTGVDLSNSSSLAALYNGVAAAIPGVVGGSPNYTITSGALSLDLSACTGGTINGMNNTTLPETTRYRFVDIILPDTVKNLAYTADFGAFQAFRNLRTITANEVTTVGNRAFMYCTNLSTVSFPLATQIGEYAFSYCYALTTVTLPAATNLGYAVFAYCYALTTVTLPAARNLGNSAFSGCTVLTTLNLGATAPTTLGTNIFVSTGAGRTITIQFPSGSSVAADWVETKSGSWGTSDVATIAQGTY